MPASSRTPESVGTAYTVALAPAGYAALRAAGYSLPLGALVQFEPPTLAEGHTLLVRVAAPGRRQGQRQVRREPLTFVRPAPGNPGRAAARRAPRRGGSGGVGGGGAHRLTLTLTDAQGRSRTVTRTVQVQPWNYPTERLALDQEDTSLLDPAIVNAELKQINAIFAGRSGGPLWSGAFRAPLAGTLTVTAPFGQRRAYNDGPVDTFHAGVDLRAVQGTPVLAAGGGRVVLATSAPGTRQLRYHRPRHGRLYHVCPSVGVPREQGEPR